MNTNTHRNLPSGMCWRLRTTAALAAAAAHPCDLNHLQRATLLAVRSIGPAPRPGDAVEFSAVLPAGDRQPPQVHRLRVQVLDDETLVVESLVP